jgi:HSP20 family molecular chaperone IbpA
MSNALIRWPGLGEYPELRHRIDHFFDEMSHGADGAKLAKLDVIEDDGKLVLRAEMPGIKPEDVKIEVADDVLTELHALRCAAAEGRPEQDRGDMPRRRRRDIGAAAGDGEQQGRADNAQGRVGGLLRAQQGASAANRR